MPPTTIRSTQIVLVALLLAVLLFTAIAIAARLTNSIPPNPVAIDILPLVVVSVFVISAAMYVFARHAMLEKAAANRDEALALLAKDLMPNVLRSRAILGAALAEGFGMLGIVTILLGGPWYVLIGPLLSAAVIATAIPTRSGLEDLVRSLPRE